MAATYNPTSLGIKPPSGGFMQGGWYSGRQYWGGTLSDPGVLHPQSNQQGAGQGVSAEVNAQSAAAMGMTSQQIEDYLASERAKQQASGISGSGNGSGSYGAAPSKRTFTPEEQAMMDQAKGQFKQPTIDLPALYSSLYKDSGIDTLKSDLTNREKAYNEATGKINDNPYYSEATRTGRLAKLDQQYQADTQSIRGQIATKTADIETQINLNSKQFDINSQQATEARNQFNTLLQLGALDNATGEDIAAITRTTGISSNMIISAIDANRAKNVTTSTITYDDGTNQGFAIINSKTGDIISKQVVAASKPTATTSTTGGGSGDLTPTQSRKVSSLAQQAIIKIDSNKDHLLSSQEYINAVSAIMESAGVDQATADNYAEKALNDLHYGKWVVNGKWK